MSEDTRNERSLKQVLERIRACRMCADALPHAPRPVIRARSTARILIVGQAPGLRVHETGIPWNDPSGDRLRDWMDLGRDAFYDDARIAIMPMGLCYPGRAPRGGDLPPRPECAPQWFSSVLARLPRITLYILAGRHAQQWYLGERSPKTVTETVRRWRDFAPSHIPLPHPSFRNNRWLQHNAWFEQEVLPYLRRRVQETMADSQ